MRAHAGCPRPLFKLGTAFPSLSQANSLEAARWLDLFPLPFSISFAVGICYLAGSTDRRHGIAKTWPDAARLIGIAYALVTSLTVFANLDGAFAEYNVLAPIRYHLHDVAEVASTIVVMQHLRARGARRAALGCQWLAIALLMTAAGMLLVDIKLPPHTHIDLSGVRASLAVGWWIALLLGELVVLWQLRRVLQQTGKDWSPSLPQAPQAARARRGLRLFPVASPLGYAVLVGGLSVLLSVLTSVLWTRATPAPRAVPEPSTPASDPCVPCVPSTRVTL